MGKGQHQSKRLDVLYWTDPDRREVRNKAEAWLDRHQEISMTKQHILDEIRRTANDGVALGVRRFFNETGIRESDWRGRFWVRWGDAVKEAGFQQSRWQGAFEDEVLLEKLIGITRELGRFPVVAELKMRARSDSSFPDPKTFRRLGSKQQLVERVRAYCEQHSGFDDVLALCPVSAVEDGPALGKLEREEVFGFVYLLKSGRYYKIGYSNAVGRREAELKIQLPEKCSTVHKIKTDDPAGIEAYWHRRFESKRTNGEWFKLDVSDVNAFRRRKFFM
jgi:hypothetical protein